MDLLCEWLSRDAPDVGAALEQLRQPASARDPYLGPYATLRFELLVEWIAYIEPRVLDVLASSDRYGIPNRWHRWIADMIARGAQVVTTNFDTRIENACRQIDVPCKTVVLSRHAPESGALSGAQLIKLHGTFAERAPYIRRSISPVTTLRQIARWGLGYQLLGRVREELAGIIGHRALVVCGYSGWDSFDVMPLLEDSPRRGRLLWYEWGRGPLRQINSSFIDPLTSRRTRMSVGDVFLGRKNAGQIPPIHFRGNSTAFLDLVWHRRDLEVNRADSTSAALGLSDDIQWDLRDVLSMMRKRLFSRDLRLRPSHARAVVRRLRMSQGMDIDDIDVGLKRSRLPPPPPMHQQERVLAALDNGQIRWATARFLDEIRRSEDPDDRQGQAETVTSIIVEMFWFAIRNGQHRTAEMLINRLTREAGYRGVLWAYPEVLYLRANLLHGYSLSGGNARWGDALTCRGLAKGLLEDAIRYALRIPRLDIVTDAIRLLLYLEPKPSERTRLLSALHIWSTRIEDGEERLLALFDLVRQRVKAGEPAPRQVFADLRLTVGRCPHLSSGRGYLATARCYMALSARTSRPLRDAVAHLRRVTSRLHPRLRPDFEQEAEEFRAYLDAWNDGKLMRPVHGFASHMSR
jgi:hypothetical protein